MGRPRKKENQGLPQNLICRSRKRVSGKVVDYYYYVLADGKEKSLGLDKNLAILEAAKLNCNRAISIETVSFIQMAQKYLAEIVPNKAQQTQYADKSAIKYLSLFFGDPPVELNKIQPKHIKMYLDWRKSVPAKANKEIGTFNHIWNIAREFGYTSLSSPTLGIKKFKMSARDVYVEDHIYKIFYDLANQDMKDLMDIAYLTGQRPVDIVGMTVHQIHDGILHINQKKTKKRLRFKMTGQLATIIERRIKNTSQVFLFQNKRKQKLSRQTLTNWFSDLRELALAQYPSLESEIKEVQFRDLRAKSATDIFLLQDTETAKIQLGHTDQKTTKRYIRKDKIILPLNC
ncbi:tyrosine-type recombinase/integrase [Pasteurella canis]|uniref:tyrosine-type recombinase/integrase n=1 Tax=Pasteurella canis TaxID=753 RepID=UPI001E2B8C32|nr:tyrosine-type recombinase/integrase [Pasteurella canis]UEC23792.1 tyrosine-type recombinase/integrase [Pasteurella canis]